MFDIEQIFWLLKKLRFLKNFLLFGWHNFFRQENHVKIGANKPKKWLENLYLDTLVITEINSFLKKVLILLGFWLFFMLKKVEKIAPF